MHHHIKTGQAHVVQNDLKSGRPAYQVYRPDGIWAKLVREFPTLELAEKHCRENGWEIIR